MSRDIRKIRLVAFEKQMGCCYYCCMPMWFAEPELFASNHGITENQAKQLQCTAEHLTTRQDGGTNVSENIVAACPSATQGDIAPQERWIRRITTGRCGGACDAGGGIHGISITC
jgi:hypothetical protein